MRRPNSYRQQKRDAEQFFPVRIRVARDQLGRERQNEDMRRWLDDAIGLGRWWHVEERLLTLPDTMLFYFLAVAHAQAFINRSSCGVWIAGEWPTVMDRSLMRTTCDGWESCTRRDGAIRPVKT
jgi:hypothetical protein